MWLISKNLILNPVGAGHTLTHYPICTVQYSIVHIRALCKLLAFPLFCFDNDWAILWFGTVPKTNGSVCSFATCLFPALLLSQYARWMCVLTLGSDRWLIFALRSGATAELRSCFKSSWLRFIWQENVKHTGRLDVFLAMPCHVGIITACATVGFSTGKRLENS